VAHVVIAEIVTAGPAATATIVVRAATVAIAARGASAKAAAKARRPSSPRRS
jgi:hypothetical protein